MADGSTQQPSTEHVNKRCANLDPDYARNLSDCSVPPSYPPPHHNRFTDLFPGWPRWAVARTELLDFMVQGKRQTHRPSRSTPSRLSSAHLHHPPIFLQARCPSSRSTNSVKALKATSASYQQSLFLYIHSDPSRGFKFVAYLQKFMNIHAKHQ